MKYTKLGNADLMVSRICMGCMGFGDANNGQHSWMIDEEHSREIIRWGLELGVNFFDTAIGYQSGTSEQYLGRALPPAVFGLLVVYCLKNVSILKGSHGIPELIAIAAVVLLHLWKRQMLLSIAGGTVLYMVLVQTVF